MQNNYQVTQINAAEQQELWLVDSQPGLRETGLTINFLTAQLNEVMRDRSEQYSQFTRQLDYITQVITPLTGTMYMFE